MRKIIYPGSFDPVTRGHIDIIKRLSSSFESVTVVVTETHGKKYFFSQKERIFFLESVASKFKNVDIDFCNSLIVNYTKKKNISLIARGVRSFLDFEREKFMSAYNKQLDSSVETVFMVASPQYAHISASGAKEVALFKGDLTPFVEKQVEAAFLSKIES